MRLWLRVSIEIAVILLSVITILISMSNHRHKSHIVHYSFIVLYSFYKDIIYKYLIILLYALYYMT